VEANGLDNAAQYYSFFEGERKSIVTNLFHFLVQSVVVVVFAAVVVVVVVA